MFCLVYKFQVKPGMEAQFRAGWVSLSQALADDFHSLGARLHVTPEGDWISYAQWPDVETWKAGEKVIFDFLQQSHWDNCLQGEVKLLMRMTVTDDLLKSLPVEEH